MNDIALKPRASLVISALGAVTLAWVVCQAVSDPDLPPRAWALLACAALVASGLAFDPNAADGSEPPVGRILVWCGSLVAGAILLLALRWGPPPDAGLAVRGAAAVAVLSLFLASSQQVLARLLRNGDRARLLLIAALGLTGAAPVWLGPWGERIGEPVFVNAVIAASPLSYLAEMTGYDYLRMRWFYAHTPLGSLRLDPPDTLIASAGYLGLALVMLVGERVSRTRRRQGSVKGLATTLLLCVVFSSAVPANAAPDMDPELRQKAQRAVDAGLHYLRNHQAEDGSWSGSVGVTAIALRGFLESHRRYSEADGAFITRPLGFILGHVNSDGSISETAQNRSYNTAVTLVALQAAGNPKYAPTIASAQKFLAGHQVDEGEGYEPSHAYYGGIGYGGDERPDLSNQYLAIEALRVTSFDSNDPVWEKAKIFLSRCQNRSESNDQAWAGNDGGFTYMPGFSPHGGTGSYGGMTHAGLMSLLFAGADKNDPRVQTAYDWIRANYTLERNPGASDASGQFYYYEIFAKCMSAYGDSKIVTKDGETHNWREDFARKMLNLQNEDGSWVNAESSRWWENDKNLITGRMVVALNLATR